MRAAILFTLCLATIAVEASASTPRTKTALPESRGTLPQVRDVVPGPNGLFSGRVTTSAGAPDTACPVLIQHQGKTIATATTNHRGRFHVLGLKAGIHVIKCRQSSVVCRVWRRGAAPPTARDHVLITTDEQLIRGQNDTSPDARVIVTGLVVGGIVWAAQEYEPSPESP